MVKEKKRPDLLFQGFILLSLLIHALALFHFPGTFENRTSSYIELSLRQSDKPNSREIPSPRSRDIRPEVLAVQSIPVKSSNLPERQVLARNKYKPKETFEAVSLPQLPDSLEAGDLSVPAPLLQHKAEPGKSQGKTSKYANAGDYFSVLLVRINQFKHYPESARARHIEGSVSLEFVLSEDGALETVEIIKSSCHGLLDEAALDAIKKASPFPKPPSDILKVPVTFRISILFQLA